MRLRQRSSGEGRRIYKRHEAVIKEERRENGKTPMDVLRPSGPPTVPTLLCWKCSTFRNQIECQTYGPYFKDENHILIFFQTERAGYRM
ncbi:hypothetical protein AMATHDRAFT_66233 [Amanita thiersii Skay4041]|uniref:Uncharacterized protein n=1 Tax=Amanita thiersii Skay4041 TaxID=703135 RepID=A0A2A9NKA3_9AGAR|nr:hypothetical protein AMATHDRAFT_66233 [Amanita thiersii Skay4041]